MKRIGMVIWAVAAAALFAAGCGGATSATDEERLITGEIVTDASAMIVKEAADTSDCVGEICGIAAYGSDGAEVQGEIDPQTYRWRIRVRAGNWMFGFLDGSGERLGYLAMNGMTAVTVEDGDEIDVGRFRHRNGQIEQLEEVADLGSNGMHSYRRQDADRDGLPLDFDQDEAEGELSAFDVLFVRPYDGQPHVAPCRPIKIVFTEAIDDATVTSDTVAVTLSDDSAVAGTLSVWEDAEYLEYEVTFAPTGGFPMGETVTLNVLAGAAGVLSEDGDQLPADLSISFGIRDWGSTSDTCHDADEEMQRLREQERERERAGQE